MRRVVPGVVVAALVAAWAGGSAASERQAAPPSAVIGVTDDVFKYGEDPGAYLDRAQSVGLQEVRVTVQWDASSADGYAGQDSAFLARFLPEAQKRNVAVVFAVYPTTARALTSDPANVGRFVGFLTTLARTWTSVRRFVVLNEPNQPRFLQPQFVDGKPFACGFAEGVLARAYDALNAVDPAITVIGLGMSPRGNDDPNAASNVSRSPVRCMKDVGDAYRASGRGRPIMDLLGQHLYPNNASQDDETKAVQWPNVSYATLGRMAQAFWDAFHGTAQPTMVEGPLGPRRLADTRLPPTVRFKLDEVGWQVKVLDRLAAKYRGRENVAVTDEDRQAQIYADLARKALCNALVAELLFFHLIDEADLDRFQSGLYRVDDSACPAADAVRQAIARGAVGCGAAGSWRHTERPIGARATIEPGSRGGRVETLFKVRAQEDLRVTGAVVHLRSDDGERDLEKLFDELRTRGLERSGASAAQVVASRSANLKAYRDGLVRLPARDLAPGRYVAAVQLAAWATPDRSTIVSRVFTVPAK